MDHENLLTVLENATDPVRIQKAAWLLARRGVLAALPLLAYRTFDSGTMPETRWVCCEALVELASSQELSHWMDWQRLSAWDEALTAHIVYVPHGEGDREWVRNIGGINPATPRIQSAVCDVLSLRGETVAMVPVPDELWTRCEIESREIPWDVVWHAGRDRLAGADDGWSKSWKFHAQQWAKNWFRDRQARYLYMWRKYEEDRLEKWLAGTTSGLGPTPAISEWIRLPESMPSYEALSIIAMGLAPLSRRFGQDDFPAWWDGVWSSWATSLHYDMFERYTNIRVTEWHIGGLTGQMGLEFLA